MLTEDDQTGALDAYRAGFATCEVLARVTEKTSALWFNEAMAALHGPALNLAVGEKRRAQMEHARQIDRAAV